MQADARREKVGRATDELQRIVVPAVDGRHPDEQVLGPGAFVQKDSQAGQQDRKRGHLARPRVAANGVQDRRGFMVRGRQTAQVAIALSRRQSRQCHRHRAVCELFAPIRDFKRIAPGIEGAELCCGEVGVLLDQWRHRRLIALGPRLIERGQVSNQDLARPAIAHGVMHEETQDVVVFGQLQELNPEQRAGCQVHGLAAELAQLFDRRRQARLGRVSLRHGHGHRDRASRFDELHQLPVNEREPSPQRGVSRAQISKRGLQHAAIQEAPHAPGQDHDVERGAAMTLRGSPHRALGVGRRTAGALADWQLRLQPLRAWCRWVGGAGRSRGHRHASNPGANSSSVMGWAGFSYPWLLPE